MNNKPHTEAELLAFIQTLETSTRQTADGLRKMGNSLLGAADAYDKIAAEARKFRVGEVNGK